MLHRSIFTSISCLDLDIVRVGDADTCRTYVFDVKHLPQDSQLRNAVFFARQRLLEEAANSNFNVLLLERYVDPLC